jgi:hypothetical protein
MTVEVSTYTALWPIRPSSGPFAIGDLITISVVVKPRPEERLQTFLMGSRASLIGLSHVGLDGRRRSVAVTEMRTHVWGAKGESFGGLGSFSHAVSTEDGRQDYVPVNGEWILDRPGRYQGTIEMDFLQQDGDKDGRLVLTRSFSFEIDPKLKHAPQPAPFEEPRSGRLGRSMDKKSLPELLGYLERYAGGSDTYEIRGHISRFCDRAWLYPALRGEIEKRLNPREGVMDEFASVLATAETTRCGVKTDDAAWMRSWVRWHTKLQRRLDLSAKKPKI